jgi:hypothetical protein
LSLKAAIVRLLFFAVLFQLYCSEAHNKIAQMSGVIVSEYLPEMLTPL